MKTLKKILLTARSDFKLTFGGVLLLIPCVFNLAIVLRIIRSKQMIEIGLAPLGWLLLICLAAGILNSYAAAVNEDEDGVTFNLVFTFVTLIVGSIYCWFIQHGDQPGASISWYSGSACLSILIFGVLSASVSLVPRESRE